MCVHKHDGSYQDIGFANTQTITINSMCNLLPIHVYVHVTVEYMSSVTHISYVMYSPYNPSGQN